MCAPYQVSLDEGKLIFAPVDADRVVRKLENEPPPLPGDDEMFDENIPDAEKLPVTVITGFLGSGKTSALKNLLENRDGIKVGVIVNDVAADIQKSAAALGIKASGSTPGPPQRTRWTVLRSPFVHKKAMDQLA